MALDKGYAWVIMMASFGASFVISGLLLTTGIMLLTLQERFQEDVTKTALVTSLYTSLSSLAGPLGSFIIQKASCRVAMAFGSLLMTSGFLITTFSTNLNLVIFSGGIIAGLGSGISCSVLFIINGFNFQRKLNIANGVSFSGAGVGLFVLAPLCEKAKELYGYSGVFIVMASASVHLLLIAVLMRPSHLEIETQLKRGNNLDRNSKGDTGIALYFKLLRDKATFLLVVSFGFCLGGKDSSFMFWPSLLEENLFSPSTISLFLSLSGISSIIGRLVAGFISSRVSFDILYVYFFSLIASGIPCICFKFYAFLSVGQIVNTVIIGVFTGVPLVVFTDVTIKCVGVRYLSPVTGLQMMAAGVGSIVTPLICGYMVSNGLKYEDTLVLCGSWLIIAAMFVLATKFTRKRLVEIDTPPPLLKSYQPIMGE